MWGIFSEFTCRGEIYLACTYWAARPSTHKVQHINNNYHLWKVTLKKIKIYSKLQEITDKLKSLELYYKQEKEKLKSDIARLSTDLRELEDKEYKTAEEYEQVKAEVVLVARAIKKGAEIWPILFEKWFVARIINTYKGEYETVGIVKTITPDFVTITDVDRKEYRRAPGNLEVIAQDVKDYNKWRRQQGIQTVIFKSRKGKESKSKKFWA